MHISDHNSINLHQIFSPWPEWPGLFCWSTSRGCTHKGQQWAAGSHELSRSNAYCCSLQIQSHRVTWKRPWTPPDSVLSHRPQSSPHSGSPVTVIQNKVRSRLRSAKVKDIKTINIIEQCFSQREREREKVEALVYKRGKGRV